MSQSDEAKSQAQNEAAVALQVRFMQGVALHQQGAMADAERIYQEILRQQPRHFGALHLTGLIACRTGQSKRGIELIRKAISLNAKVATAHNDLGNALLDVNGAEEALASYDKAIALKPDFAEAYTARGVALRDLRRFEKALASQDKAIALNPNAAEAYNNRGNVLLDLKRTDAALASYEKAITLRPDFAEGHNNRGNALLELKRTDDALASYEKAIALKPGFAQAHSARGDALLELERSADALASYDKALQLQSSLAEAWLGRGNVFRHLRSYEEASAAFDKALALKPDLAGAWLGRGNIFYAQRRYAEALDAYDKALALKPDVAGFWLSRGNALNRLKRHSQAAEAYAQALKIDPDFPFMKGMLLHQKMLICDWKKIEKLISEIESDIGSGKMSADPFGWQGVAQSERSLQLCAELYNKNEFPSAAATFARRVPSNDKIRVGYLSGDFREQATSFLLVGILEEHDRDRFEIYAFDNGWDDQSKLRGRINDAVHGVIDIARLGDSAAASVIYDHKIDILVNLNGYFGEQRTGVFANRPAPVQVNYLGFPGTLGAPYMDYIIADRRVIPESNQRYYTESVAYLPYCYQANDRKREIGTRIFHRAECGLPENRFVFCCFNKDYKIVPDVFDLWMRILKQVEGSVIWLLEDTAAATNNLRIQAVARGVNAERLVFAERMSLADHLARHRLADLFLDTLPYNAHTTASDALWAGLPLLTCLGETFAGRVSASLLDAINLPELITTTPECYEKSAIDLATHPQKLAIIKRKLADNRLTTQLFDTKLITRYIEAAYTAMYERFQAGLPPDHIWVPQ
jgi:predicted O-linked N-acetylglucosamine transferase (SPINDLY family)